LGGKQDVHLTICWDSQGPTSYPGIKRIYYPQD
jgi:hypothetical protein